MHIGHGNRDEWKFIYSAPALAEGAKAQKEFRTKRVVWWKEQKEKIMVEIRATGLEVNESVAAQLSTYSNMKNAPQISIRADLQQKLGECHGKILEHQQAADEYEGWIQVLTANPNTSHELLHSDWLYFFGKS